MLTQDQLTALREAICGHDMSALFVFADLIRDNDTGVHFETFLLAHAQNVQENLIASLNFYPLNNPHRAARIAWRDTLHFAWMATINYLGMVDRSPVNATKASLEKRNSALKDHLKIVLDARRAADIEALREAQRKLPRRRRQH